MKVHKCFCLIILGLLSACNVAKVTDTGPVREYVAADKELYKTITAMDSVFFAAYNTCDLVKQAALYASDIEFYHDKGGLMTSKQDILNSTEKFICGKVTRTVVAGSIEVYPIKDYGAVEIGFHRFYNNQEPDAPSVPSKFIIVWHHENDAWKISKVISLH